MSSEPNLTRANDRARLIVPNGRGPGRASNSARNYPAPRWQTPLPRTVAGSYGPDVAAYAQRELGITLDRWQRRALNRALAADGDGRLVHRLYLVSTARQAGKTALVRALIGAALTGRGLPPWRFILGLAHDRTQARIPYEAVMADLAPIAARVGPYGRRGLAVTRYLGIRSAMYGRHREYHVASREAANAIRGYTTDLDVFDEVRTQRDWTVWAALEPTLTGAATAGHGLIVAISTAGDDRSVLLRSWFDRGLRVIDGEPGGGFGMTWYAPPDDAAPDDPRTWRLATPAIADGRVGLESIAESFRANPPETFRSERLNLWATGSDTWLPAGAWSSGEAPDPELGGQRVVLGVEASATWSHASIVAAVELEGRAWVQVTRELRAAFDVEAPTIPPELVLRALESAVEEWRPEAIAYSNSHAIAPALESWAAGRSTPLYALTPARLRMGSELFRSEVLGGRLMHRPDPLLADQVRRVRPSAPIETGRWYLSVAESAGDVDAVRAAAWAVLGILRPAEFDPGPQVF
jgi:hypothetical protein